MEEKSEARKIRVTVYSDYTCPWCYVGAARLEQLRHRLQEDIELADTWMPFEIHPEVPAEGMSVENLPYSAVQLREMNAYLRQQAEAEGLAMVERDRLTNTHRALAAATFVQDMHSEHFRVFHEQLFEVYFGKGDDLNDLDVLRRIAIEAGVPPEELEEVLDSGEYDDAIAATGEHARRLGITGTPTYVFENQYAVVGAHPVDTLYRAVMEVVEKAEGEQEQID